MNEKCVKRLLRTCQECGVPLQAALSLVFRVKGIGLPDLARVSGSRLGDFQKAITGTATPSHDLRQAMVRLIGVDPWTLYADSAP